MALLLKLESIFIKLEKRKQNIKRNIVTFIQKFEREYPYLFLFTLIYVIYFCSFLICYILLFTELLFPLKLFVDTLIDFNKFQKVYWIKEIYFKGPLIASVHSKEECTLWEDYLLTIYDREELREYLYHEILGFYIFVGKEREENGEIDYLATHVFLPLVMNNQPFVADEVMEVLLKCLLTYVQFDEKSLSNLETFLNEDTFLASLLQKGNYEIVKSVHSFDHKTTIYLLQESLAHNPEGIIKDFKFTMTDNQGSYELTYNYNNCRFATFICERLDLYLENFREALVLNLDECNVQNSERSIISAYLEFIFIREFFDRSTSPFHPDFGKWFYEHLISKSNIEQNFELHFLESHNFYRIQLTKEFVQQYADIISLKEPSRELLTFVRLDTISLKEPLKEPSRELLTYVGKS
jgi:hypothetical protein